MISLIICSRFWFSLLPVIMILNLIPHQAKGGEDTAVLVILIDHQLSGFTYSVDGKDASADLLTYLDKHQSNWPSAKTKVVLLVHEQASLAMVNNWRGMIIKAGYEPPRVFEFNKDKRLMVEIAFLSGVPFSVKGPT